MSLGMKIVSLLLLSLLSTSAVQATEGWTRLSPSDTQRHSKNVARQHLGAYFFGPAPDRQPMLIKDDPAVYTSVPVGTTEEILQLGMPRSVNRFTIYNDAGAGKISLFSAQTQGQVAAGQWTGLGAVVFEPEDTGLEIRFGAVDAAYIRIVFEMAVGSDFHEMALFGTDPASAFRMARSSDANLQLQGQGEAVPFYPGLSYLDFNLARIYTGGQVAYLSSGNGNPTALIDNDATTFYAFPANDPSPTLIVQLGTVMPVDRITALLSASVPGTLYAYALPHLDEERNWMGRPSVPRNFLDSVEPVAVQRNVNGAGRFVAEFPARMSSYIALRFVPAAGPQPGPQPGAGANFAQLRNAGAGVASDRNLAVVGIGAFSSALGGHPSGKSGSGKSGKDGTVVDYAIVPITEFVGFDGPLADFSSNLYPNRTIGRLPRIPVVSP